MKLTKDLKQILDLGIMMSSEKNHYILLESILNESMNISNCDGGTLYICKDDTLHFFLYKTLSKNVLAGGIHEELNLPPLSINEKSVAGNCALNRKIINVPDVYNDNEYDWTGPKKYDELNNYHTKSVLVVPLIDNENELIGVMQLINAQDDNGIIPFSKDIEYVITSLSSQCSILLSNKLLLDNIQMLLDSFVNAMTAAIDSRTPFNAKHTKNVSILCEEFIDFLIENKYYDFSKNDKEQLVMAAMLHDVGKMSVPISILNKSTRLEGKLDLMKSRWNIIELDLENKYLKNIITEDEYNNKLKEFKAACDFILFIDTAGFIDPEKQKKIDEIIKLEYNTAFGVLKIVEETEENDVHIIKGTLTKEERHEIEKHVEYTKLILKEIEFGKKYKNVEYIAGAHHEYIDGSGYPLHIKDVDISKLVRILTIMDVYESLTATDRPYKKPMPKERAYSILKAMVEEGKLDGELVAYFGEFIQMED
ncbi:MAG: GAF domain-containing protein [Bacilli bacterium]|nr:GAF domain-containing protein [Bacilli bacterium]